MWRKVTGNGRYQHAAVHAQPGGKICVDKQLTGDMMGNVYAGYKRPFAYGPVEPVANGITTRIRKTEKTVGENNLRLKALEGQINTCAQASSRISTTKSKAQFPGQSLSATSLADTMHCFLHYKERKAITRNQQGAYDKGQPGRPVAKAAGD